MHAFATGSTSKLLTHGQQLSFGTVLVNAPEKRTVTLFNPTEADISISLDPGINDA